MNLLSVSSDAKTIKGETMGVLTGILYMAPADTVPGINTCPAAVLAGCREACLYSAGRGAMSNVQKGRIRKTELFRDNRHEFMMQLAADIFSLIRKAKKEKMELCVRLNGTSDIKWENIGFTYNGVWYENIMQLFPNVQFYDYTKMTGRNNLPMNYDITFSYSGVSSFQKQNQKAIDNGMRIAVVFRDKDIPNSFKGIPVINGDESDLRYKDPKGCIVGLYAKGKARKDNSGFVVDIQA